MDYLSYKELQTNQETLVNSLKFHRNKLKLRVYNTNPPFASQPALLENQLPTTLRLSNITPLRTDYIDGKVTTNNKVELIIDLAKESKEDSIAILNLAHTNGLMTSYIFNILIAYVHKLGDK